MNKFKIGDKVRRITMNCGSLSIGEVGVVCEIKDLGAGVRLQDRGNWIYGIENLELVNNGVVPHIHKKEIIAWANGSSMQVEIGGVWHFAAKPTWEARLQYRVRPELTVIELAVQALEKYEWEEEVERRVQKRLTQIKFQEDVEKGIDMLMHNA